MENAGRLQKVVQHETAFVSKVEPQKVKPWNCDCYNVTDISNIEETECTCYGKELKTIPSDLPKRLRRLTVTDSEISSISRDSFQPYKDTLTDV